MKRWARRASGPVHRPKFIASPTTPAKNRTFANSVRFQLKHEFLFCYLLKPLFYCYFFLEYENGAPWLMPQILFVSDGNRELISGVTSISSFYPKTNATQSLHVVSNTLSSKASNVKSFLGEKLFKNSLKDETPTLRRLHEGNTEKIILRPCWEASFIDERRWNLIRQLLNFERNSYSI